MSKLARPPSIAVQGAQKPEEETPLGDRQSSLLPGQVRTPSYIVTMADWAAPGSCVWDEDGTPPQTSEPQCTPLAGYVRDDGDVWLTEYEAPEANATGEDTIDPANVAHAALSELRAQLHENPAASQAPEQPTATQAPQQRTMPRTESEYWGFSTNPNQQQRGSPTGSAQAEKSSFAGGGGGGSTFRVSDGTEPRPATTGPYTASTARPPARPPTLEDERVAHSIIASAGLPLSVTSLLSYIREGQPHLEQPLTTTATGHRNFPNLSEPAPEDVGPGPMLGGGYPNQGMGGAMPRQGGGGNGGWTVEGEGTGMGPGPYRGGGGAYPTPSMGSNRGYGGNRGNMMMPTANQGPYRGGGVGAGYMPGNLANHNGAGAMAAGRRFPPQQQPTYANVAAGQMPLNGNSNNMGAHYASATAGPGGAMNGMGMAIRGPGGSNAVAGTRPKSESEILSDLLHFHANFFPPPPPPHVPVEARRRRAELWYHYASKWDITHRLPPPPRSPLAEMEMEYRMKLPEKTRVPYHGDDWLRQCDLWFRVVQSLFDYPEENIAIEADLNVILEHAVLS